MKNINDLTLPEIEKQIVLNEGLLLAGWQKYAEAPAMGRVDSYLADTDTIRAALFILYGRRMVLKPTEH